MRVEVGVSGEAFDYFGSIWGFSDRPRGGFHARISKYRHPDCRYFELLRRNAIRSNSTKRIWRSDRVWRRQLEQPAQLTSFIVQLHLGASRDRGQSVYQR
jgi:hypothetical protein